tara:strand:- start:6190 stop:6741 length:552 start_codon:yes stop_codon:yes gene_type:complete
MNIQTILLLSMLAVIPLQAVPPMPKVVAQSHQYKTALAVILPTQGNAVQGTFSFSQEPDGVRVSAILTGLTPNQDHGVHIHQWGDISDQVSGKSAGGHYNPEGHPHGLPPNPKRHAGSFGNISADENGEAKFDFLDTTITIAGRRNPIIGRSVVVHAKPDTGEQPAGNAGPRIGLGVIGIAKF